MSQSESDRSKMAIYLRINRISKILVDFFEWAKHDMNS